MNQAELLIGLLTFLTLLVGLIVAIRQLLLMRTQIQNHYDWSKRVHALSYSLINSQRLSEARIKLDKAFGILASKKEGMTLDDIDTAIKNDPSIYTEIMYVLAHWENMALAIHAKVADEDVAFEMVAGMVISFVLVFRNFIERRKKENDRVYGYLLRLTLRWEERLRKTDMPIFEDLSKV
jgi:hypothetical protein